MSNDFAPGDRIRIVCGVIAGETGVVRFSARSYCIVAIDCWPEGVYVRLPRTAIEPLNFNEV
jgi:hypothetical protein